MSDAARLIERAREIDGLTQQDTAKKLGLSTESYRYREAHPEAFRIYELAELAGRASAEARAMILKAGEWLLGCGE